LPDSETGGREEGSLCHVMTVSSRKNRDRTRLVMHVIHLRNRDRTRLVMPVFLRRNRDSTRLVVPLPKEEQG